MEASNTDGWSRKSTINRTQIFLTLAMALQWIWVLSLLLTYLNKKWDFYPSTKVPENRSISKNRIWHQEGVWMHTSIFQAEISNPMWEKNQPQNRGTYLNAAIAMDHDPIANKWSLWSWLPAGIVLKEKWIFVLSTNNSNVNSVGSLSGYGDKDWEWKQFPSSTWWLCCTLFSPFL